MPVRPAGAAASPAGRRAPRADPRPVADVTAVLVSHDGAAWLPTVLAALDAQTVRPRVVVGVDTGSSDDSPSLLLASLGGSSVVQLGDGTGYGAAVAAGLLTSDADTSWVWLLHDDAAPAPDALEQLLRHAEQVPSAGLLGPKALDWDDPRVLVEVGITTDAAGHRETGLERREPDQGQHDSPRDVLSVGTAGALVRRDLWDSLGGLDPALPLLRDDLDLGWRVNAAGARVVVVPAATVRHVRALTTGRREPAAVDGPLTRVDRTHGLLVLLAHLSSLRLLVTVPALLVAGLLRVLGSLVLRRPAAARDELAALTSVLGHPGRLRAMRRERARTRTVPPRAVRPLLTTRLRRLSVRLEALAGQVAALAPPSSGGTRTVRGSLRRLLTRPGALVALGLLLVTLLATRSLLTGDGPLVGGRLLPVPGTALDLWRAYGDSWHETSVGSPAAAPPALAVLAALATVLLGQADLLVSLLLLGSVPLAGVVAYAVAGRVVRTPLLRAWAAATWALLPVATGAVATGRLDAAAASVVLPALALGAERVVRRDPRDAGWHRAWALGLALAATVAVVPTLWPYAVLGLLVAAAAVLATSAPAQRASARRRAAAAALVAAVPVAVLWPWPLEVVRAPGLLVHGPGRLVADAALLDPALPAWRLLLLHPGGEGLPPVWVTAGLVLAALGGLLRTARAPLARAAWAGALLALGLGLLLARLDTGVPGGTRELPAWPGTAVQLAGLGLLLAALVAADGLRERLSRLSFTWRQPAVALVTAAAVALPAASAVAWVLRGADAPLQRGATSPLPAFARAELESAPGLRVLALDPRPDGSTGYALLDAEGARLGDPETAPRPSQLARLDEVVADLLAARGSDAAAALATRAVRLVVLPAAAEGGPQAAALDAQPGLSRLAGEEALLWEVAGPTGRLVVLPPATAEQALSGRRAPTAEAAPGVVLAPGAPVPPGPADRLLVLSEAAHERWRATLDGRELPQRTAWGWATAVVLPASGGERLVVEHDRGDRSRDLGLQGLALLVVGVLAAPGDRRRRGLEPVEPAEGEA